VKAAKKIGFAVVGLGSIAQSSVLPAFANAKKARLVALVSRDKKKAKKLARKFGADNAYGTDEYSACLSNPDVSAIYIATPQGQHEPLAIKAAEAGKHVLCEKPLAATVEQSARIVAACQQHNVLLMTAYRKYFEPSSLYLKKLIREGSLGRIDVIHTAFSELHLPGTSLPWLLDARLAGGGPLMDLGVYCVNTTRWLVDEDPVEVSAQAWQHDTVHFRDVEEGIAFRMNFRSGLVVQGTSTYGAAPSSFIHVQGTKGWALLSPAFPFEEERHLTGKIQGRWFEKKFKVGDEFAPELDALATAIQTGGTVEPDGRQGHRDVQIIHAIYASAKSGAPVVVRYDWLFRSGVML
jgi:predicted dehydrogenase